MTLTLEYAADTVKAISNGDTKIDLFNHFVTHFGLTGKGITFFAVLCGFPIEGNIRVV